MVTSSWNSPRCPDEALWRASGADLSVLLDPLVEEEEASEAAVEADLRIWRTRLEVGRVGLWKRVIGSRVLGW